MRKKNLFKALGYNVVIAVNLLNLIYQDAHTVIKTLNNPIFFD